MLEIIPYIILIVVIVLWVSFLTNKHLEEKTLNEQLKKIEGEFNGNYNQTRRRRGSSIR